jgi:NAD(P)-dependent dehydrogenase (short-subunit alcohol dehydrogenase family)
MPTVKFSTALIVGAGSGLSAALARVLTSEGIKVALAARTPADLVGLTKEIDAQTFACDASKRTDVEKLFADLDGSFGAPEIVIYNPSYRTRGPIAELDPAEVEKALMTSAFGGFLVGQQAVKRMLPKKHGCVVFTGASASVKGYAQSAAFAMGKFALRGLAQSMSRELHPKGIHVAHIIIDGGIKSERRHEPEGKTASLLNPTSIAATYLHVIHQPHSAWSAEVELRPWVESF